MIAPQVLLGRPRATSHAAASTVEGGRFARAVLVALFGAAVLLESDTADPILYGGTFLYRGIGSWSGLPLIVSPLELLLIAGLAVAIISNATARRATVDRRFGGVAMLLLLVALSAGLIRGFFGGGDMYVGFWEVRALLYVPACYAIARMAIRTRGHLVLLMRVGLVAAVLFAIEGAYRRVFLIDAGRLAAAGDLSYQHEDAVVLVIFILFVFSAHVFGAFHRMRVFGLVASPVLLYTLLATERRAGIIVLLVGLLMIALVVFMVKRKVFFITALPVLAGTALYLAMFWGAAGVAGQPARAVRSLYEPNPRDASSNLYRVIETYDISQNIQADPLLAVGFGREFNMVIRLPDLSWWQFWRYETHNSVLWLWLKTGGIGYVLIWSMLGGAVARAAFAAKRLADPELRAISLFCLVSLVGTVVFAYVDLGFVSHRLMILLGTVLGILAVVESLDRMTQDRLKAVRA